MVMLDIRFEGVWYTEEQYVEMKQTKERYEEAGVLFNPFTIKTKLICGIEQAEELFKNLEENKHGI